jgi:hypothetical protein
MTIAERIFTLVKTLTQSQANEILLFAESISSKQQTLNQADRIEIPKTTWAEFVHSLAGVWADDFPDLEQIRSSEGQDITRESFQI